MLSRKTWTAVYRDYHVFYDGKEHKQKHKKSKYLTWKVLSGLNLLTSLTGADPFSAGIGRQNRMRIERSVIPGSGWRFLRKYSVSAVLVWMHTVRRDM